MKCTIIYEKETLDLAEKLASSFNEVSLLSFESVLNNPEILEDFNKLGLVFQKEGKAISENGVRIITEVMGNMDLKPLEYLFTIVQADKPQHSLRCIDRLLSSIGCASSYNACTPSAEDDETRVIENGIAGEEIRIAPQSIGTGLYMRLHMKGSRR